jgi:hypothetical protein
VLVENAAPFSLRRALGPAVEIQPAGLVANPAALVADVRAFIVGLRCRCSIKATATTW